MCRCSHYCHGAAIRSRQRLVAVAAAAVRVEAALEGDDPDAEDDKEEDDAGHREDVAGEVPRHGERRRLDRDTDADRAAE